MNEIQSRGLRDAARERAYPVKEITKSIPQIQNQMDNLEKNIEGINTLVGRLEERICGVLLPPGPEESEPDNSSSSVPFAERINLANSRCRHIIKRVESIVERCQL